jgi:Domain of unknown function (DUF397)
MDVRLSGALWRKSSHSSANGQCVEVARNLPGVVAVRDSKNPAGPALMVGPGAFAALVTAIKDGGFAD